MDKGKKTAAKSAVIEAPVTEVKDKKYLLELKPEKAFKLPNGSDCVVRKAKGKHSMQAQEICAALYGTNVQGSQIINQLICAVTTVDGEAIAIETLEDMWSEDYTAIQAAFMEINGNLF